jgi:stearoyl-CoA desaturase (delta-9 desaturase)
MPRLAAPTSVDRRRVDWPYAIGVVSYHLIALLALWPALFTWTGVASAVIGIYVFGTLGINLGYHRLLTHRSFACPRCGWPFIASTISILTSRPTRIARW